MKKEIKGSKGTTEPYTATELLEVIERKRASEAFVPEEIVKQIEEIKEAKKAFLNESKTIREQILEQALEIVMKERNANYGDPENNFQTIARLWGAYLGREFTTVEVSVLMILVKISRIKTSPKVQDHWVDIAGYAACGAECSEE